MLLRRDQPRTRHRALRLEQLGPRIVLAASPLGSDVAEAEGESHFVERKGELVFVIGTDADNDVKLQLGTEEHRLTVDGIDYNFAAAEVNQFQMAGVRGDDELQVMGSHLDDRVVINGTEAELRSGQYRVLIESFEVIRLFGARGDDRVRINDSPGNDQLFMHSTFSTFVADGAVITKVSGFERVEGFASGGNDRVSFYDSPENDRFHAKDGFSFMVGSTFWNYAKGFSRVDAYYRTGGADEAILRDSDGNDELNAEIRELGDTSLPSQANEVVFRVGDAVHAVHGFPVTRVFAENGNDVAKLKGQVGVDDIFVAQPNSAFLRTPDVAVNFAVGFDRVEAFGGDAGDRAELKGSGGDDEYVALPQIAELRGDGFQFEANDFGLVRAFGRGGNDMAWLQDSPGDDRFDANDRFSILRGDGFTNYIEGFVVDVLGSTGDDFALHTEYGPEDFLIHDGNAYIIWGPERNERVVDWSRVIGESDGAVWNVRSPITIDDFLLRGHHDASRVPSAEQLEEIFARLDMFEGRFLVADGNIDFSIRALPAE